MDSDIVFGLLRLPHSIIIYIFDDFLKVKNIHYTFFGNLKHIKNGLYNECIIETFNDRHIKWGNIYNHKRKQIYKLLTTNQHLNKTFCEIFKHSKIRSENISKIKLGTIISIYTINGETGHYIVDAMNKKSILGIKIEKVYKVEVTNRDGCIVSNESNVIHLLYAQRWLDINYLKQEHLVCIDFQPFLFFVDANLVPLHITEYCEHTNFFELPQTKSVTDFRFKFK